jgi:hypothetical protein
MRTINSYNKYKKGRFAMYNQGEEEYNPFIELSSVKYAGETLRLFLFYMGVVQYDNRIKSYTQQEISDITNIARTNISKANKILMEDGIIYKDGRDYYFNDKYLVKGLKRYKIKK